MTFRFANTSPQSKIFSYFIFVNLSSNYGKTDQIILVKSSKGKLQVPNDHNNQPKKVHKKQTNACEG